MSKTKMLEYMYQNVWIFVKGFQSQQQEKCLKAILEK